MTRPETYVYPGSPELTWYDREDRDRCVGAGRLVDAARSKRMFIDPDSILRDADVLPENREAAFVEAIRQLAFFDTVRDLPPSKRGG